jgi:hypothetical protein
MATFKSENRSGPAKKTNERRARAGKPDVAARMIAVPGHAFEYFPSPESSDDEEIIAYLVLYCEAAVTQWLEFRHKLEETGAKSVAQCDQIEKHAIDVFREARDAIMTAIDTDNPAIMSDPRLRDRLVHAHAYLALHADPASLVNYRRMICAGYDLPAPLGDFMHALWEGKWNVDGDDVPSEVTRHETRRSWLRHEKDELYNTSDRLDPVATAGEIDPLFPATEPMRPLSPMQFAFIREKLRTAGMRAGLKRGQADFLVRTALDNAKQEDNPTAWRAIRDRKSESLLAEVQKILEALRTQSQNHFCLRMCGLQELLS